MGVIIDNKLNFSAHIDKICKKVNSKSFLIARSIHLFTNKIRPTLFKLLIQPNFDYCCTLFIKTSKANRDRLEKCFNKSIHRILKINISTLIPENQILELVKFNILPIFYRQILHFSSFLYKIVTYENSQLFNMIQENNKSYINNHESQTRPTTRNNYIPPNCNSDFKKHSFTHLSVLTLNSFLSNFITNQKIEKIEKKQKISLKSYFFNNIQSKDDSNNFVKKLKLIFFGT